jgi:phosphatidylinositol alpha-mannosyltransferase
MLDGGRAGALFPTGDADALHDTVLSLLVDPVRRGGVVVRAARYVRRFDWSVVAKQVLDVYDEALPGPGVVASA